MARIKVVRKNRVFCVVGFTWEGELWSDPVVVRVDPQFEPCFGFDLPPKRACHAYAPRFCAVPLQSFDCEWVYNQWERHWDFERTIGGPHAPVPSAIPPERDPNLERRALEIASALPKGTPIFESFGGARASWVEAKKVGEL